ncbi:hypothetical protein VTO73DRAFT_5864 [Trametes versicolor]
MHCSPHHSTPIAIHSTILVRLIPYVPFPLPDTTRPPLPFTNRLFCIMHRIIAIVPPPPSHVIHVSSSK